MPRCEFPDATIDGQVDGTHARRSPGSTLKPFLYALAFDQGLVHPATVLEDVPTRFADYDPDNFDRTFVGPITARDALVRSRNVPAILLAAKLTRPTLHGFLRALGVGGLREEAFYPLPWHARTGHFVVSAVDSAGRSSSRTLDVANVE